MWTSTGHSTMTTDTRQELRKDWYIRYQDICSTVLEYSWGGALNITRK